MDRRLIGDGRAVPSVSVMGVIRHMDSSSIENSAAGTEPKVIRLSWKRVREIMGVKWCMPLKYWELMSSMNRPVDLVIRTTWTYKSVSNFFNSAGIPTDPSEIIVSQDNALSSGGWVVEVS
jgi:hypothetical protein